MNRGISYGVSIGPGDSQLITNQALSVIEMADVIFIPSFPKEDCVAYRIIKQMMPDIDKKEICPETFTMSRDATVMKKRHQEIYENAIRFLDAGKTIAFLTLGEVALYSTYLYIHNLLIRDGYESKLISGISSVQAIAAKLAIPLALGNEEVHIFPNAENLTEKLSYCGTKVFMKSRVNLDDTIHKIQDYCHENPGTAAAGISNCGMDGEIIAYDVDNLSKLSGYFTVIIVFKDRSQD